MDPKSRPFTKNGIGSALALRDLRKKLRQTRALTDEPSPMPQGSLRFLSKGHDAATAVKRALPRREGRFQSSDPLAAGPTTGYSNYCCSSYLMPLSTPHRVGSHQACRAGQSQVLACTETPAMLPSPLHAVGMKRFRKDRNGGRRTSSVPPSFPESRPSWLAAS